MAGVAGADSQGDARDGRLGCRVPVTEDTSPLPGTVVLLVGLAGAAGIAYLQRHETTTARRRKRRPAAKPERDRLFAGPEFTRMLDQLDSPAEPLAVSQPPVAERPDWRRHLPHPGFLVTACLLLAALLFARGDSAPVTAAPQPAASTPRYTTKNIEDVRPGDTVLARDEHGHEVGPRRVLEVYRRTADHLRILTLRDAQGTEQVLKTTDEHPFWSASAARFVLAADLKPGDRLDGPNGEAQTVAATLYEPHPEGVPVHNFQVAGHHTYYALAKDARGPPALVHNANGYDAGNSAKAKTWDTTVETPWGRTVHHRSDIDWNYVRPDGSTNAQAAAGGNAPVRPNSRGGHDIVVLHHSNNDPGGNVFEVWTPTHNTRHTADRLNGRRLKNGDPRGVPDPLLNWRDSHPQWARDWDTEQSVYWKWTQEAYMPPPGAIRVPPSLLRSRFSSAE